MAKKQTDEERNRQLIFYQRFYLTVKDAMSELERQCGLERSDEVNITLGLVHVNSGY